MNRHLVSLLLLLLMLAGSLPARGQSIIASTRLSPTATDRVFTSIDVTTGVATPISPPGPTFYAGLAVTPAGQFYSAASAGKLFSVDVLNNTSVEIGSISPGLVALEIMADGRAFGVQSLATGPQIVSVDLPAGTVTPFGSPTGIVDLVGSSSTLTLGLGSVGDTLYAIDQQSKSLIAVNPNTGAVSLVGGTTGLLNAGTLSNGIARSRYFAFGGMTGVDLDRNGQYDTLFFAVNSFDHDDNPATANINIGGLGKIDLQTSSWELIGTNPGVAYASMASLLVPEPSTWLLAACGSLGLIGLATRGNCRRMP